MLVARTGSNTSSVPCSTVASAILVIILVCMFSGPLPQPTCAQSASRSAAKYNPYQSAHSYSQSSGAVPNARARSAAPQAQNGGAPARHMQQKQQQPYYQQSRNGYGYPFTSPAATAEDDYQNDEVFTFNTNFHSHANYQSPESRVEFHTILLDTVARRFGIPLFEELLNRRDC